MKITNRQAHHEYTILETLEAGVRLLGAEVKMIKAGRMNLEGAYVRLIGSEAFLVNAEIPPYPFARMEGYDSRRTRKLLLHKKELIALTSKIAQSNLTLIPLSCYNKGHFVKIEIGLARGKKKYEKREAIRRKDMDREVERELRNKIS